MERVEGEARAFAQLLLLAHERLAAGDLEGAQRAAARALRLGGRAPDAPELAAFALDRCDIAAAEAGFRAEMAAAMVRPDGWIGLAEQAFAAGGVEEAVEAARRATIAAPGEPHPSMRLGQFLLAAHLDPVEAEAALRDALALGGPDGHGLLALAEALLRQGRQEEALATAVEAHLAAPRDAAIRQRHAEFHLACGGDPALAEAEFRALVEAGPPTLGLLAGLADALWRLGKGPAAIEILEEAQRHFPDSVFPQERLAHLLIAMGGDPVRAEAAFRAAILGPDPAEHLFIGLAEALKRQDRGHDAYCLLKETTERFPRHHAAPWTLGLLILEAEDGDLAEAEQCFHMVSERRPGDGDAQLGLAEVYRRQKRIKEAVAAFRIGEKSGASAGLLRIVRFRLFGVMD